MSSAAFSGTASVTYADGSALVYTSAAKYCTAFEIGTPEYERSYEYAPGVDGAGSKTLSFSKQKITLEINYVTASESNGGTTPQTDALALAAAAGMTLVVGGVTFNAVFLESFEMEQPKSTGLPSAQFHTKGKIVVYSRRLS